MTREEKWALRFLKLAKDWSAYSKDPSTQTGAVIVRPDLTVVSIGYNGFAPGVKDTEERLQNRAIKYRMILHCELNALLAARESLSGYTLYNWPAKSCAACAAAIIKSGITRIVSPKPSDDMMERWAEEIKLADAMLLEARVENIVLTVDWIANAWDRGDHLP